MLQALEGSQAVARAVALCRPQVVAAYPITPQTHIVEGIARLVADGQLHCEYVSVESEFSAASVALGAAAAGSRAYTASASQGMLLMAEVLYNIAGLRVPLVMTCANRALSSPVSIWNDQQDAMAVRDAGWVQLFCADIQEAVDTHIQAYRISERTEVPVMVCMDGFTLTHTLEPVELPNQQQVDGFLPAYHFDRALDPGQPMSLGTLVSPEFFSEVRHDQHQAILAAAVEVEAADQDWATVTGRDHGGLLQVLGDADARVGILALGGVLGTLEDARDEIPDSAAVRLLKLRCFRPFPVARLVEACTELDDLIVLERALGPGGQGILTAEVRAALYDLPSPPRVHGVAAGLGGRDMPLSLLPRLLELAGSHPQPFRIIDLRPEHLPREPRP